VRRSSSARFALQRSLLLGALALLGLALRRKPPRFLCGFSLRLLGDLALCLVRAFTLRLFGGFALRLVRDFTLGLFGGFALRLVRAIATPGSGPTRTIPTRCAISSPDFRPRRTRSLRATAST
jgi:hypothetical protein